MEWIKPNTISQWYGYIWNQYKEFIKTHKNYRCKIVGMETDEKTKEIIFLVLICGIKNQIIRYFPKDLIIDDLMLEGFSPFDARAITFYSLMQIKYSAPYCPKYCITGQDFLNGKTIYILNELKNNIKYRKTAQELYCNTVFLDGLSQGDLINVVSTAIQEQAIEDLHKTES